MRRPDSVHEFERFATSDSGCWLGQIVPRCRRFRVRPRPRHLGLGATCSTGIPTGACLNAHQRSVLLRADPLTPVRTGRHVPRHAVGRISGSGKLGTKGQGRPGLCGPRPGGSRTEPRGADGVVVGPVALGVPPADPARQDADDDHAAVSIRSHTHQSDGVQKPRSLPSAPAQYPVRPTRMAESGTGKRLTRRRATCPECAPKGGQQRSPADIQRGGTRAAGCRASPEVIEPGMGDDEQIPVADPARAADRHRAERAITFMIACVARHSP